MAMRILTLHGQGLQGLGILHVLDEICNAAAQEQNLDKCLSPCDLFDVISGTGIGAFLAILLGRYSLDIVTCKQHYMDLVENMEEQWISRRKPKLDLNDVELFMESVVEILERKPAIASRCQSVDLFQRHGQKSMFGVYQNTGPIESKHLINSISKAMLKSLDQTSTLGHNIVFAALEEYENRAGLLVNVGVKHERPESIEKHRLQWFSEKTSAFKKASTVPENGRKGSLSLLQWPMNGVVIPTRSAAEEIVVRDTVTPRIRSMVAEGILLDLSFDSVCSGLESDMSHLKSTRGLIQEMVASLRSSGTLARVGSLLQPADSQDGG